MIPHLTLPTPVHPPPPTARQGWTLIELLGVLAVITILALAITPSLLRELQRSHRLTEETALQDLAEGLTRAVVHQHQIPNAANINALLATELGLRPASVLVTRHGTPRVYLIDPNLRIGPTTNSVLPYTQSTSGSVEPISPRVLFIASLSRPLPAHITSGVASSATEFQTLWNTADGSIPAGWTWSGSGDDLKIQRVNFAELFVPLILNNNDTTYGRYAIDGSSHVALSTNCVSAYFLRGTALGLRASDGTLQSTEVLQDPCSFVYEKGVWRGKLFMNPPSRKLTGLDLQAAFDLFMSSPINDQAKFGTTQGDVTSAMFAYMSNYVNWAASGFSPDLWAAVAASQVTMASKSMHYTFKAGTQ